MSKDPFIRELEAKIAEARNNRNGDPYSMSGMIAKEVTEVLEDVERIYLVLKQEGRI